MNFHMVTRVVAQGGSPLHRWFSTEDCMVRDDDGRDVLVDRVDEESRNRLLLRGHVSSLAFSQFGADPAGKARLMKEPAFAYSAVRPLRGKSKEVAKLRIQLGMACNCRCVYCLQSHWRDSNGLSLSSQKGASDQFMRILERSDLNLQKNAVIDFWGGEPLLYMTILRELIPALRHKWGFGPRMSIFTNGLLLSKEISDFLVRNRVTVEISHDGPGNCLRVANDPLDDPRIKANWLNLFNLCRDNGLHFGLYSVITPLNCDLFSLRSFFHKRFSPDVCIEFGGAVAERSSLPPSCLFDSKSSEILKSSILRAVTEEPGCWQGLERRVHNAAGRLVSHAPSSAIRYHCNAVDEKVLCCDLLGRVISCQNRTAHDRMIGTLENLDDVLNPYFVHWSHRRSCTSCPVLPFCKGGCPDMREIDMKDSCRNDRAFHLAVFNAAWFLLTGETIERITPANANNEGRAK